MTLLYILGMLVWWLLYRRLFKNTWSINGIAKAQVIGVVWPLALTLLLVVLLLSAVDDYLERFHDILEKEL